MGQMILARELNFCFVPDPYLKKFKKEVYNNYEKFVQYNENRCTEDEWLPNIYQFNESDDLQELLYDITSFEMHGFEKETIEGEESIPFYEMASENFPSYSSDILRVLDHYRLSYEDFMNVRNSPIGEVW